MPEGHGKIIMGPPKSRRLFGERRSNEMSELLPLVAKGTICSL
ncbi:hypothetical protein CLOSTMETH_01287 [[Clostridium] methylpentosum DSM 5476]|uniref:Uncharacterized protein n=1 Tax=[Clostridium] methylpentosum DSM 5476 TaxID=537013 RepID=C0EBR9_9FIRM|nr:hypothetical protein CLOSTMETH_01287 [[Clostridium] methylpentosum DSM 5476]